MVWVVVNFTHAKIIKKLSSRYPGKPGISFLVAPMQSKESGARLSFFQSNTLSLIPDQWEIVIDARRAS
jgi:hypothetical protein